MLRLLALPWSPLSLLRLIAPRGARVGTHVGKLSVDCVGITESAHHGRQRVAGRFNYCKTLPHRVGDDERLILQAHGVPPTNP
jgi:hypothetical protein